MSSSDDISALLDNLFDELDGNMNNVSGSQDVSDIALVSTNVQSPAYEVFNSPEYGRRINRYIYHMCDELLNESSNQKYKVWLSEYNNDVDLKLIFGMYLWSGVIHFRVQDEADYKKSDDPCVFIENQYQDPDLQFESISMGIYDKSLEKVLEYTFSLISKKRMIKMLLESINKLSNSDEIKMKKFVDDLWTHILGDSCTMGLFQHASETGLRVMRVDGSEVDYQSTSDDNLRWYDDIERVSFHFGQLIRVILGLDETSVDENIIQMHELWVNVLYPSMKLSLQSNNHGMTSLNDTVYSNIRFILITDSLSRLLIETSSSLLPGKQHQVCVGVSLLLREKTMNVIKKGLLDFDQNGFLIRRIVHEIFFQADASSDMKYLCDVIESILPTTPPAFLWKFNRSIQIYGILPRLLLSYVRFGLNMLRDALEKQYRDEIVKIKLVECLLLLSNVSIESKELFTVWSDKSNILCLGEPGFQFEYPAYIHSTNIQELTTAEEKNQLAISETRVLSAFYFPYKLTNRPLEPICCVVDRTSVEKMLAEVEKSQHSPQELCEMLFHCPHVADRNQSSKCRYWDFENGYSPSCDILLSPTVSQTSYLQHDQESLKDLKRCMMTAFFCHTISKYILENRAVFMDEVANLSPVQDRNRLSLDHLQTLSSKKRSLTETTMFESKDLVVQSNKAFMEMREQSSYLSPQARGYQASESIEKALVVVGSIVYISYQPGAGTAIRSYYGRIVSVNDLGDVELWDIHGNTHSFSSAGSIDVSVAVSLNSTSATSSTSTSMIDEASLNGRMCILDKQEWSVGNSKPREDVCLFPRDRLQIPFENANEFIWSSIASISTLMNKGAVIVKANETRYFQGHSNWIRTQIQSYKATIRLCEEIPTRLGVYYLVVDLRGHIPTFEQLQSKNISLTSTGSISSLVFFLFRNKWFLNDAEVQLVLERTFQHENEKFIGLTNDSIKYENSKECALHLMQYSSTIDRFDSIVSNSSHSNSSHSKRLRTSDLDTSSS
jgi:hypothetical protein